MALGSLVLVVGALFWAQKVFIPLALAILLTFILTPAVAWLQRHGLRRTPAAVLAVLFASSIFVALSWVVTLQIRELASELPDHTHTIVSKITDIQGNGTGAFAKLQRMVDEIGRQIKKAEPTPASGEVDRPMKVVVQDEQPAYLNWFPVLAVPVIEMLASLALIVMLIVFMLIMREDLRFRVIQLIGHGRLTVTTRALDEATERISAFLFVQLIVNVGFGTILGVGLALLGVPYAFLWGFLAAALRFVPYIGTWLSLLFPLALSVAIAPDWYQPLLVFGLFLVLEVLTANVLEPLLFSHSTGVSPVALLVAAAFWTWLWGPIGLILSTPMTVCLVVLGRYVPHLGFFDTLLGSEPVMAAEVRYYQRLLAQDEDEATELVEEFVKERSLEEVYDEVLLPALVMGKRDRARGDLEPGDEEYVHRITQEVVDDLEGLHPESTIPEEDRPRVIAIGCPARDKADQLALNMLGQLLKISGCDLEVLSTRSLSAELIDRVRQEKPALVCITALPPGGLTHASHLCKRLRALDPDLKILVGRWGQKDNVERMKQRLLAAGASFVGSSLAETRAQAVPLIQVASAAELADRKAELVPVGSR